MSFKGGYVDGQFMTKQVEEFADIPSREEAYRSFHGKPSSHHYHSLLVNICHKDEGAVQQESC